MVNNGYIIMVNNNISDWWWLEHGWIMTFQSYWEFNHPNWRTQSIIFQRGRVGIPPTSHGFMILSQLTGGFPTHVKPPWFSRSNPPRVVDGPMLCPFFGDGPQKKGGNPYLLFSVPMIQQIVCKSLVKGSGMVCTTCFLCGWLMVFWCFLGMAQNDWH